jgi:hypothetical protein
VHDVNDTTVTRTLGSGDSEPEVPELLVGRYRLGEVLGRGGSGVVYAAKDQLTGDPVAVKMVPALSAYARRQLRRELSALLALRLPGVVRLRDEGSLLDRTFFVTDLIEGVGFCEGAGRDWASWRPRVVGLLDVIARVHLAGVVHRDLKPANVMVDHKGQVVILDFGLAQGRLVERASAGLIEGTPRYMAPEQREGRASDERTDLYAVGGMILELVTGEPPARPPRLDELRKAAVPAALVEMVERMLAEDPAQRPASALDVLAALDADPRTNIGTGMPPGPWTELQLRELFVDKKRSFLHLAEDAAALLFEVAGGDERATRAELDRWIRAGLASWSGDGRLLVSRQAIEQIAAGRPGSPQSELVDLLEAGAEPEEVSAAARRIGAAMADSGHLERALSVLDAAELWARGTPSELGLLHDRVAWSLGLETPGAAERALYRVQRAEIEAEERKKLGTLLRGGRAAFEGDTSRALQMLADKPPELPESLEIWWHALRWKAVSQMDLVTHERELESIAEWAKKTPLRTSKWQGWVGYLRYRQQRYGEAAELLLKAAETRAAAREKAQMLHMAAAASLEAGDGRAATHLGTQALEMFRRGRHALHEGTTTWLLRMVTLRLGLGGPPDLALVEAAADIPAIERLLTLNEAGFAFRMGDIPTCIHLASRARSPEPIDPVTLMAEGLVESLAPGSVNVQMSGLNGLTPQLSIQILGLLARGAGPREEWRTRAAALLPQLSHRDPDMRLELISIREAVTWLGLELPHSRR